MGVYITRETGRLVYSPNVETRHGSVFHALSYTP